MADFESPSQLGRVLVGFSFGGVQSYHFFFFFYVKVAMLGCIPTGGKKNYSGAHSRVATLIQPSFQKKTVLLLCSVLERS